MKQQPIPLYIIDKAIEPYESLRDSIKKHLTTENHSLFYDSNASLYHLHKYLPKTAEDIIGEYIEKNPLILPPKIKEFYGQEISALKDSLNITQTEIKQLRENLTFSQKINYGSGGLWLILMGLMGYKTLRKKLGSKNKKIKRKVSLKEAKYWKSCIF